MEPDAARRSRSRPECYRAPLRALLGRTNGSGAASDVIADPGPARPWPHLITGSGPGDTRRIHKVSATLRSWNTSTEWGQILYGMGSGNPGRCPGLLDGSPSGCGRLSWGPWEEPSRALSAPGGRGGQVGTRTKDPPPYPVGHLNRLQVTESSRIKADAGKKVHVQSFSRRVTMSKMENLFRKGMLLTSRS